MSLTAAPADSDQRPDPEDLAFAPTVFWSLRAGEVLGAAMFMTVLPWWQPAVWWVLVAGSGSWRTWYLHTTAFKALSGQQRRLRYRLSIWLMMFCVGSAWLFLYTPGNQVMLLALGMYLLASAALVAQRAAGDVVRTLVAVSLVLLPTAFRLLADGMQQRDVLLMLLGLGGPLMALSLVFMSRVQERALMEQYDLRQRAERAADAVAGIGLAKSRFFAAVSHDLRQPVHAIGLYLDPLTKLARNARDEPAQRAAEGIRQSWRALDDLLSQVLDLTRMDSGALQAQLQPVELAPLIRDLVMQHSAAAERVGIRIVALAAADRWVLADALMLKRVLSNLLDNAIKFSPPGRAVVVALRRGPAVHGSVHTAAPGAIWRLQVRDAGRGIAREAQAKIFEEFVQLNNEERDRRRGLGLGLAISKRFTQLMGGSINVRSAPGQGCCMTVSLTQAAPGVTSFSEESQHSQGFLMASGDVPTTLPAALSPLDLVLPAVEPQPPEAVWTTHDVLLVEDDLLVSAAMRHLLQSWGLQVRHVETGAQAMLHAAFGQLAICDVRLPGGESGLEVALKLRAKGKRVLLISGETDPHVRSTAQLHGLKLLIKPVSSHQLRSALQQLQ